MTERVQGPAYSFPSIEKKYGRPIGYARPADVTRRAG